MSYRSMEHHSGYTITGSPPGTSTDLPFRHSQSVSIRREPKYTDNNLRILYRDSISSPAEISPQNSDNTTAGPTTPILPPTPPHGEDELDSNHTDEPATVTEVAKSRSAIVTPVNQHSPPTPELTPPREYINRVRPFLEAQPSLGSTRADSFKTAPEDINSDGGSDRSSTLARNDHVYQKPFLPLPLPTNDNHKPSPLAQSLSLDIEDKQSHRSSTAIPSPDQTTVTETTMVPRNSHLTEYLFEESPTIPQESFTTNRSPRKTTTPANVQEDHTSNSKSSMPRKEGARRGPSLRERLEESRSVPRSSSVDKFADIIGWSEGVHRQDVDTKRWSIISMTSTVEAYVVEQPQLQSKRGTLRHMSKRDSLRSASSPLPNSHTDSPQKTSDSAHRLTHKTFKLDTVKRGSFGSEVSRPISVGCVTPTRKTEVIKVAIIPERNSSLQSSTQCSRRHSQAASTNSASFHLRVTNDAQAQQPDRRRTVSGVADRGRGRYYPPQVPARGSSLSAPTSRSTSRANSITSEHVRIERKKAERDLRSTLERMESERSVGSPMSLNADPGSSTSPQGPSVPEVHVMSMDSASGLSAHQTNPVIIVPSSEIRAHDFAPMAESFPEHIIPGSTEWAALRPASILGTPFSLPSFLSQSPEINEAQAINLFPHNNHSIQLIDPFPVETPRAVQELRVHNSGEFSALPQERINSPLRNPRRPPQPPQYQALPPPPPSAQIGTLQLQTPETSPTKRWGSLRIRPTRARTDSFGRALIRSVSLKNPQNKKADQDLDPKLNPFWRPRAFWDDMEPERAPNPESKVVDREMVQNSLGVSQPRSGPIMLMHRISQRRRERKTLAKQVSYNSLQRLRAGRRLYRIPGLGLHLPFMGLRDIQSRFATTRQRKEAERREKRREVLRQSIGPPIISTADSRFPAHTRDSDNSVATSNGIRVMTSPETLIY